MCWDRITSLQDSNFRTHKVTNKNKATRKLQYIKLRFSKCVIRLEANSWFRSCCHLEWSLENPWPLMVVEVIVTKNNIITHFAVWISFIMMFWAPSVCLLRYCLRLSRRLFSVLDITWFWRTGCFSRMYIDGSTGFCLNVTRFFCTYCFFLHKLSWIRKTYRKVSKLHLNQRFMPSLSNHVSSCQSRHSSLHSHLCCMNSTLITIPTLVWTFEFDKTELNLQN